MRLDCQKMNQFNKLAELFKPIERSLQLPLTDLVSRAEIYDESPELLISVCSLYYLNRLSLHISMVPILSGFNKSSAPEESVRKNADMALEEAIAFSELLQQFVTNDLDTTRLWPFSAYTAFMAGSVLLVRIFNLWCKDDCLVNILCFLISVEIFLAVHST